jgi:hypothetical protein
MTKFKVVYHTEFGPEVTTKATNELVGFSKRFTILSITEIVEQLAPVEPSLLIKKFEVTTHWLVFLEKGDIIQFDGKEHYRVDGDQTNRRIPKEVVENCPLWFKEITAKK